MLSKLCYRSWVQKIIGKWAGYWNNSYYEFSYLQVILFMNNGNVLKVYKCVFFCDIIRSITFQRFFHHELLTSAFYCKASITSVAFEWLTYSPHEVKYSFIVRLTSQVTFERPLTIMNWCIVPVQGEFEGKTNIIGLAFVFSWIIQIGIANLLFVKKLNHKYCMHW